MIIRLIAYALSVVFSAVLAFSLFRVRNTLARMFGLYAVAWMANSAVFFVMLFKLSTTGHADGPASEIALTLNALSMAVTSGALAVYLHVRMRNGGDTDLG